MAAHPINTEIRDKILLDWRMKLGSQADLADKYKISKGAVNGICKGVEQDAAAIVNAGIQYNQMLVEQDDRMMTAVQIEVAERTKHLKFFTDSTVRNMSLMVEKLGADTTIAGHAQAQSALNAGKENILGKSPETAIQINNNQITKIERVILKP